MPRHYSEDEIKEMAREIIESLRPRHLAVYQIRDLAEAIVELTDYIVLRELPAEESKTAHE